ncbi:MAG: hypothetical protein A3H01_00705 [Candidatus Wildermuthbacteria bacterium RIFCSPLOWO2_12_FULL_40_9]|uniref:Uncharacterized protein n=2 Tax=Candidatus Wildermuthiibacteriota TaxID=1817923 RepID=A0A1G2REF6_9BACT|nr:MAG: hypothetical protein A3F15_00940 [Candidatus Wildermuthbacteria bacterium RIFCSPHIGHO2_12_FULL_40_12]OHA76329.1 MAG: hypothetical protein A3H01_00705 [Candidatus Wildermuthbacteria bacterium RIFCSPLOWO2_12_FULL_40_9]
MGFPTNIEALRANIEALRAVVATRQNAVKVASDEVVRQERRCQENQAIVEILNDLLNSWQDHDPGKNHDVYFFLDAYLRQRVVVREFLPDDAKVYQTRKEWEEYDRTRSWHGANYDGVPYWYPVVNLDAAGKSECSECKSVQPVVEHYVQTYDSPEGDEWLKEHLVLCLDCNSTTVFKSKTSDSRFYL